LQGAIKKYMKKISIITSIHPDFDKRIYRMAKSVADAGYQVELICPWNVKEGIKEGIYYKPFKGEVKLRKRLGNYRKIWKLLISSSSDLFHFHDLDLVPLMAFFALTKRKDVIYDIHENYSVEMKEREYIPALLRPIVSFGVKWIEYIGALIIKNLVIVVDSQEKQFSKRQFNVIKVRNFATLGILEDKLDNYSTREDSVIFIGAQTEANGSLLFLQVANEVINKKPDVKFYCIDYFSDSNFKKEFFSKINEYGLSDSIVILPPVKSYEIMKYINLATIALSPSLNLPSKMLGLPTKTFEYMAGGLPIVSNNHPYPIKFIQKNGIGLLANPDIPSQFVDHIIYLIDHREEAEKMGEKALNCFITKYNWEKEIDKLLEFYEGL
jgi:glycosyltransferase involved in cell wall biosynthesis